MPDNAVETHYTRDDLGETILAALKAEGKDLDRLTPDDLAPVDEFHGGQRPATVRLAELVGFTGTERVLDVGSGLGGPSRYLAWQYGCRVSGVDLTAEFVRVAEMLTQLTGLVDKVDYRQGNALDLPFEDASFDVVWSQNAAMNIADRERLYREMRRVLKPGGKLALQEVGRAGRPATLSGAMGARAGHQLSLFAGYDPQDARGRRFSCRDLAGHDAIGIAIGSGAGAQHCRRAAGIGHASATRRRLAGDVRKLRPQPRGTPHRAVQRGAGTRRLKPIPAASRRGGRLRLRARVLPAGSAA